MTNDQMIADFMGYNFHDDYIIDKYGYKIPFKYTFSKRWGWLMRVVVKILNTCNLQNGNIEDFHAIRDCIPDIESTYKAAIDYIKQYNIEREEWLEQEADSAISIMKDEGLI